MARERRGAQRVEQVGHRREALRGIAGHSALDRGGDVRRDRGRVAERGRERLAEAVLIGARVDGATGELLGRHEGRRPDDDLLRRRGADRVRQAEVDEAYVPGVVDEDVLRLDVAVHEAGRVHRREPPSRRDVRGDDVTLRARRVVEPGVQGPAAHELHRDERLPVHGARVEDADDVRVIDARQRDRLLLQPRRLRPPGVRAIDLDRQRAIERGVVRLEHDAHATRAQQPSEPVPAELRGELRAHGRHVAEDDRGLRRARAALHGGTVRGRRGKDRGNPRGIACSMWVHQRSVASARPMRSSCAGVSSSPSTYAKCGCAAPDRMYCQRYAARRPSSTARCLVPAASSPRVATK